MALDETRHNLIFNTSREHYGSFVSPVAFSYDIPSMSVASLVLLCNLHIFITLYFFKALLEYVRTVSLYRGVVKTINYLFIQNTYIMECVTNKIGSSQLCYENVLLSYELLNFFLFTLFN